MKILSDRYTKVLSYKDFDICTLKAACPADQDPLGYFIDNQDFFNQEFNLIDDAIQAIELQLKEKA